MDKALKQRLVGASVLVALAVVVLPMLLSGQPENQQESRRIDLPDKPPELSIETRRFPIGDQDGSQPSVLEPPPPARLEVEEPVQQAPLQQTSPTGSGETHSSSQPLEQPEDTPPEQVDVAAQDQSEPESQVQPAEAGRYLVQVASFSNVSNANRLAGRLRQADMPVLLDTVEATAGVLHRVRIGPFSDRGQADGAITELNRLMPDLSPRVMDLRPDETAPVSDPSDPLIRWVVQVGSFGEADNADNLVFRLRDAGYRASSLAVTSDGATSYKVRVGPVILRQDAVDMAAAIQRDLGLDGLVMSAD